MNFTKFFERLPEGVFLILLFFSCGLVAQPSNDNCANASAITVSSSGFGLGTFTSVNSDLTNATVQSGEHFYSTIQSAGQTAKSVWYKFSLPTARKCTVALKQPSPIIGSNEVGFTIYKANSCFPTSAQADDALLAAQTLFGQSTNPCLQPGDYMVQVSSNNSANGPIYIELTLDNPAPTAYDKAHDAYNFGTVNSCQQHIDFGTGCLSIDSSGETCAATGSTYTQSAWFVFTTPNYQDYISVMFGPVNGNYYPNSSTAIIGYNLYRGDARSTALSSMTKIDGCVADTFSSYQPWFDRGYECNLLDNTAYTIQLFFDENFVDSVRLYVNKLGNGPGSSVKPLSTAIALSNKLGTLPSGQTNATDDWGCNTRLSINSCGDANPAPGVVNHADNTAYDLALWYTFTLNEGGNLTVSANSPGGTNYVRIFNKNVNASCGNIDTANELYAFENSGTINCMQPGNYTMQILGNDAPQFVGNPNGCNTWRSNLGQILSLTLNLTPTLSMNHFGLNAAGKVDTINRNGNNFSALVRDSTYNSQTDTFACGNTVLPTGNKCSNTITKAVYREFSTDSGIIYISFNNSWNYYSSWNVLYSGNASALASGQSKYVYPDSITGLTPASLCMGNQWCVQPRACVVPGIYTLATYGDSTLIAQNTSATVSNTLKYTKYSSATLAENMGSLIDTLSGSGGVGTINSSIDYFSCIDNPKTIGGLNPCPGYNNIARTKLIYRQFYLSQPSLLSISASGSCSSSPFIVFSGKATSGIGTLSPLDASWQCVTYASTPTCSTLPAGWYTVVCYGEGPTYSNPTTNYYMSAGAGGDIGLSNQISITLYSTPPGPKFDWPFKAAVDSSTGLPFLINPGTLGTPVYPQTDTTYTLYTEHFNCILDTPFSVHPVNPCTTNYTPQRAAYYTFRIAQEQYIRIMGLSGLMAEVFPFNVRTDSAKMMTISPVQPCINDANGIMLCRLQAGTYTLVVFVPDYYAGSSITPQIYTDVSGYSRFDHALGAYDFGVVPPDSAWHYGKTGDVNPLNSSRAPSDDFFYCTTGAQTPDPASTVCYNQYDANIYNSPQTNNPLYSFSNPYNGVYPRRNLWYTFVLNNGGNCTVQVNPRSPDKTGNPGFVIYRADDDGSIPFSTLVSTGAVDSTVAQGLTFIGDNTTGWCSNTNSISFYKEPCPVTINRYYVIVDMPYNYDVNYQLDMQILWDTVPSKPVKYDFYSNANFINGLNQVSPPYTIIPLDTGISYGATDNYMCATSASTDPQPTCSCTQKNIWYKFKVNGNGVVRMRYKINGADQTMFDSCQMMLLRENPVDDSTQAGFMNVSGGGGEYFDPNLNLYWSESCVTTGTYNILMTGCGRNDEDEQPIVWFEPTCTHYDNYGGANFISVLSQLAPPYTDTALISGIYKGGVDNYTCATSHSTDPASMCFCYQKNMWYKFRVNVDGNLRMRYQINGADQWFADNCQMLLLQQTAAGDSTTNGLTNLPFSGFPYTDSSGMFSWAQECISAGTYYILMTGCNRTDENEQPIIWFEPKNVHYDYYAQANVINGLNQLAPPYTNVILGSGIDSGGIDNYTCATQSPTDPNPMSCTPRNLWYKFQVDFSGYIRLRLKTNGQDAYSFSDNYMQLFQQVVPGDSTSNGLVWLPSTSTYYDTSLNINWGQRCIAPGTYYILLTGCNMMDNTGQPIIWLIDQAGDFCSKPINGTITAPGNITMSAIIDCHTIGGDFGEDGSNMGCLIPNGDSVTKYKSTWFKIVVAPGDTFDVTPTITNNTNVPSNKIRYRWMFGNCSAMNTGSCFVSANTTNTFNCLDAGTYYIQVVSPDVVDNFGTPSTGQIQVTVSAVESAPGCAPVSHCFVVPGFAYSTSCNNDSIAFLNQSTAGDSIQYLWRFGYNNKTSTAYSPKFLYPTPSGSQSYNVTLIVNNTTCGKIDSIIKTVIVAQPYQVNLGNDTSICVTGSGSPLSVTIGPPYPYPSGTTFQWSDGSANTSLSFTYFYSGFAQTTSYSVTATYNGCTSIDTINYTFVPSPTANLGPDQQLCPSQSYTGSLFNGFPGEAYLWSNGDTLSTFTTPNAGTYWGMVSYQGCTSKDTVVISTISNTNPLGNDTALCVSPGHPYNLNATVTGGTFYQWNDGSTGPTKSVTNPGTYWVQISTSSCFITYTVTITSPGGSNTTVNVTICQGKLYTLPNGIKVGNAGSYIDTITVSGGCDSIVTTHLSVTPMPNTHINVTVCAGVQYTLPNGSHTGSAGTYVDTLITAGGCDSVVTVNLSVNPVINKHVNATICSGAQYTLPNGSHASTAGTYVDTLITGSGCDSIVTVNLSVNPIINTHINASICSGAQYTLPNGSHTGSAGTYVDTLITAGGCDSVVTVNLSMNPIINKHVNATICSGAQYTLPNGSHVSTAGTYVDTLITGAGCDSIVTVNLSVNPVINTHINVTICAGAQYTLPNGSHTSTAGTYTDTLIAGAGCDSIITVNLSVNPVINTHINVTICAGAQYTLPNGSHTSTAGTYIDTLIAGAGCDSIITVNLSVNPVINTHINATICAGAQYTLPNGSHTSTAGTYVDTLITGAGCDSIVTVNLSVNPVINTHINVTICAGAQYTLPNGSHTSTAGTYVDTLITAGGCDSIITVNLSVNPVINTHVNATICAGAQYTLPNGGHTSTAGTYVDTLITGGGCDSVITVNLSVKPVINTHVNATICAGALYTLPNGSHISTAGTYVDTLITGSGCDSIITVNLSVNPVINTHVNVTICPGAQYTLPNGGHASTAGTYVDTLITGSGCDSIITVNLSVNPVINTHVNVTICAGAQYTLPNGGHASTAGTYVDTLITGSGCDSIVTVNLSVSPVLNTHINATICAGAQYVLPNGSHVNSPGTYIDTLLTSAGCDSVITTNLSVTPIINTHINATICAGSAYTLPNGSHTGSGGTYVDTLITGTGCDSVVTVNLLVNSIIGSHVNATICASGSYSLPNGTIVNAAGTYTDTLLTASGCDSVITTSLSVNSVLTSNVSAAICTGSSYTLPGGTVVNAAGTYADTLIASGGCDSVITTTLSINSTLTSTINASICPGSSYTLPGGTIVSNAGTYNDTLFASGGCDSIVTTTLSITTVSSSNVNATICAGGSYILPGGQVVNVAGTYTDTLTAASGCDSIISTMLSVAPVLGSHTNATICVGGSYILPNGTIVNIAGTYTDTLITSGGCDSVVTTTLSFNPVLIANIHASICAGASYTLPGGTLVSAAGTYSDTLITTGGCDSVVNTTLTVNSILTSSINASICAGNSYTLPGGSVVNTSGTYKDTLIAFGGCDSVVTTILTLNSILTSHVNASICSGNSYTLPGGSVVNTSGTYSDTLISSGGCDSVVTTTLSINSILTSSVNASICAGNSYTLPGGSVVNTSGTYNDTLIAFGGCDSVVTTILTLNSILTSHVNASICSGNSYTLPGGSVVNTSGTYSDTLISSGGCDSVVTTTLSINSILTSSVNASICAGNSYTLPGGSVVNTSGTYNDTLIASGGCDSVVTTTLSVNSILTSSVNASICTSNSYTLPGGSVVNTSGTYNDTLISFGGCDSVVTTILTVNSILTSSVNASICTGNSYTLPGGSVVNTSGTYNDTLISFGGCDSVVTTILTVNSILTSSINASICAGNSYTLPGGSVVNTSGTYSDTLVSSGGCDSVVTTILTLNSILTSHVNASICAGNSYTLPGGSVVNTSGTYNDTLISSGGCDSVVTTILAVNSILNSSVNASICAGNSYTLPGGNVVNASGTYNDTLVSSGGCDSVVTTTLSVNSILTSSVNASICSGNSYTLPGGTVVNASGTYNDTLVSSGGCDSVVTTILTVNSILTSSVNASICTGNSYTLPGGSVVNTSGTYNDTLVSSGGCDSIVTTTLGVNSILTSHVSASICSGSSYTLPGGTVVNTSGTYIDTLIAAAGCDSVVITTLTANPIQTSHVNASICAGNLYTLPKGRVVNTAGTYADTLTASGGCDSVVTTILTVNSILTSHIGANICAGSSYTLPSGRIVHAPGTYNDTLNASIGCDSIVITTLSFNQLLRTHNEASICEGSSYELPNGKVVNRAGVYIDTIQANGGCDSVIVTTTLSVNQASITKVNVDLCLGQTYQLPSGTVVTTTGSYADTLLATGGCDSIVISSVSFAECENDIYIPNAFTPNGDGNNDIFKCYFKNAPVKFTLKVFNRWGEKVFETSDVAAGWDGVYKGELQDPGVFVYIVEATFYGNLNYRHLKGSVTLIR